MRQVIIILAITLCVTIWGCGKMAPSASPVAQSPQITASVNPTKPPAAPFSFVVPVKYIFVKLVWNTGDAMEKGANPVVAATEAAGKMMKATLNALLPDHANYTAEDLIRSLCDGGTGIGEYAIPENCPVLIIINKKTNDISCIKITKEIQSVEYGGSIEKFRMDNADGEHPMRIWLFCKDSSEGSLKFIMRSPNRQS